MVDSHIHLDQYQDDEIKFILNHELSVEALITVSTDLSSCKRNLSLSNIYPKVHTAFGYHPEQPLPSDEELSSLMNWMSQHSNHMVAVGEVGLPYYLRLKEGTNSFPLEPYISILKEFIKFAKVWDKPIILHAVYDDAPLVCDLLEQYSIQKAHFHWFKGDQMTVERMIKNGYYISYTPDLIYEKEIQQLALAYPLEQIFIETDGPWPFEGPFHGKRTNPLMMKLSIQKLAELKNKSEEIIYSQILTQTKKFYMIK